MLRGAVFSLALLGVALAAACAAPGAASPEAAALPHRADLVLRGGDLWTMDPERPRASALAVRGERIIAVGDDRDVEGLIDRDTQVIELRGRSATPGLVDGHAHVYGLGASLEEVSLRGAESEEAAAAQVLPAAAQRAPGEWITGRGWDQNLWKPPVFPHHRSLDRVAPDHPVALRRIDGHALWANRAAMRTAGVDKKTPEPPGGRILRDSAGAPTGVFVDAAMKLIESRIPAPSAEVRERRILAAAHVAARSGLTAVHDMGIDEATAAVYRELAARGRLPIRVYGLVQGNSAHMARLRGAPVEIDRGSAFFILRGIKLYADGALGSRGAALLAPYADDPGNRGLWLTPVAELEGAASAAAAHGWQLAIHAIGDAANRAVLDAYERVIRAHPDKDLRFRIEHAQVVSPADLPRFGRLGVLASMQPTHATSDMVWAEARLGPERLRGAYAWRSIVDSGGRMVAGSDFPVEAVSPLLGLYAAVTRQDERGQPPGGWHAAERLQLEEAVRAFTSEAAFASFVENMRGRLRPGYLADVTVYDGRLESGRSLLSTEIEMTVVGGRIVFARK